jgi:4-alpha-glucanotransferase
VLASVANLAVVPMQDVLGLGSEARMNVPGEEDGNWAWRFAWKDVDARAFARLRDLSELYGRIPATPPDPAPVADSTSQHAPAS